MASSNTVSTRFIVISDTHEFQFNEQNTNKKDPLNSCLPKADVLLHCGDLTQVSGMFAFKKALKMMSAFDTELKLVIAGNHDFNLDRDWSGPDDFDDTGEEKIARIEEELKDNREAEGIMKGDLAKEAGVTYLDEGTHTFCLSNGAKFTVYASPYTPGLGAWGFPYKPDEDRFNTPAQSKSRSIAINPIPSFPDVQIVMTHGPPRNILDKCPNGNLGCENLLHAVRRARPLMHCFGHIHESYGSSVVTWTDIGGIGYPQMNSYPVPSYYPVEFGSQTLMVNAAMEDENKGFSRAPFLVDFDLPRQ